MQLIPGKRKQNISELVDKAINFLFIATVIASICINLFDIFRLIESSNMFILYTNIPAIIVILVSFLLKVTNFISLKLSFSILVISILANSIISITQSEYLDDFIIGILRESIFMAFLISLSAFVVSRFLAYFISFSFCCFIIILYLLTKDNYILENLPVIILVFVAYTYFMNYLISMLNNAISELQNNNITIKEQLEEIKTQNEELSQMNEELNVQQELLREKNEQLNKNNLELIVSRNELKNLNETKNKLFSVIGHDIKNPMHVIMGYSRLLQERYDYIEESKKKNYIKSIDNSISKLYYLLENLLTWSKSQQGHISYSPENIDLNKIIAESVELFDDVIKNKEINVIFSTEPNLKAYCDKNMIKLVLRNIIDNAVKYSNLHGIIKITGQNTSKYVILSIKDNGIGIPKEIADSLFELSEKNSRLGTSGEKGTGFGLAISKDFILKNKGEIWHSNENNQTVFNIKLPTRKN